MKFLIVAPRQNNGGSIVQHLLCKLLTDRGYDARIFYIYEGTTSTTSHLRLFLQQIKFLRHDFTKIAKVKLFPNAKFLKKGRYNGYAYFPIKDCKRTLFPILDNDTIVVYSEGIGINFLHAKKIVRWFLFFKRHNDAAYEKDALYFSYREIFNDANLNPTCRLLRLRNFDYDLYRQTNFGERSGCCYMLRKGNNRPDLPEKFNGPILDTLAEADIVKAFNEKKYCYFYDTQTFYASIASICGCIPIVVPEAGKTRADYTGKDDNLYGIAYGDSPEEISYALATREKLMEKINNFKKENEAAVDYFIAECKRYFYGANETTEG